MPNLTGGQALIQQLRREGIRTVFGVPGAGQYEAIDALYLESDVRYISLRHEQASTYMADGYARASGEIAAALLVPGPGFFNATAGMITAYAASSPILVITGSRDQGPEGSPEMIAMRGLTKWAARADTPAQIPSLVHEAVRQLRTGRSRPVALDIPPQVFAAVEDVLLLDREKVEPKEPEENQIAQAADLLVSAQRPLIWAGGGIQRAAAWDALQSLVEHLQIPVVTSRQGKGVLPDNHPLSLGMAELRFTPLRDWLTERDLILAIGTSGSLASFPQQIIRIDIDPTELEGHQEAVYAIEADAKVALELLLDAIQERVPNAVTESAVQAEVQALNRQRFAPTGQLQPQWDLMMAIRSAIPDDAILIQGMNQMGYYSRNYYPVFAPRSYLTSSSHATLGCALPVAMGAKIAQPKRAVVALSGDGGFLYNSQELATAVQQGINVITIVFNDNAYGNVLRAQIEEFDERVIGTELYNPDFMQLAEAYGVHGIRAAGASQLEEALRSAIVLDQPTLIEVPVGMMERVY
ncbi:thiamine pyrophosphate-binding protein [Chloroflexi bacterium TSY]|nr:thiamine pyrophosphate-binding protein [Chloroflexi bacterium TSY]